MSKEEIVCVDWIDASYNSGYYDEEKPDDFSPYPTKTVGFLVKADKDKVIVAHDRFYKKGKLENQRHITTIPRKMVQKVSYLGGINESGKK